MARSVPSRATGPACGIFDGVAMRMPLVVVSEYDSAATPQILQARLPIICEITDHIGMAPMTLHPDSLAVHAGRDDLADLGVHALPLDLSSTNPLPGIDVGGLSYEVLATGGHPFEGGSHVYARLWNPTVARFEEALARLEHAEEAVAFSSGMAAMTAVLLAVAHESGKRHIVAVRPLYGGTDHLLASGLLGVEATFCTPDEVAAVAPARHRARRPRDAGEPDARARRHPRGRRRGGRRARARRQHVRHSRAAASARPRRRDLAAQRHQVPRRPRRCRRRRRSRATRRSPPRCGARARSPARSCIRSPPTSCTAGSRRCRCACGPAAERARGRRVARRRAPRCARCTSRASPQCDPHGLIGTQQSGPGRDDRDRARRRLRRRERASPRTCACSPTRCRSAAWTRSSSIRPRSRTARCRPSAKPSDALVRLSIGLEDPADLIADLEQAFRASSAESRVQAAESAMA